MSNIDSEFRTWMDERKLRAEMVGNALDVSPQTIRNWRSGKIPRRQHGAVLRLMRDWDTNPTTHMGPRLVVNATDAQFEAWNRAANADGGKLISEWAIQGLDELARDYFENQQLPVPLMSLPTAKVADSYNPDAPASKGSVKYPRK